MTSELLTVRTMGNGISRIGRFANPELLTSATQRFLRYYCAPIAGQIDILVINVRRWKDGDGSAVGTYSGIEDLPPKVAYIEIYVKRRHSEKSFWVTFYHELDHLLWYLEQPDYACPAHIPYACRPHEIRAAKRGTAWMYRHLLLLSDLSTQPKRKRPWWGSRNPEKAWQKL